MSTTPFDPNQPDDGIGVGDAFSPDDIDVSGYLYTEAQLDEVAERVERKPYKAWAATGLTFLGALALLWFADTDGTTVGEVLGWVVQAAVTSGIIGGTTYAVKNPPKTTPRRRRRRR